MRRKVSERQQQDERTRSAMVNGIVVVYVVSLVLVVSTSLFHAVTACWSSQGTRESARHSHRFGGAGFTADIFWMMKVSVNWKN